MFELRTSEAEFLDDPGCDHELTAASYRFMTIINAWAGGTAVVRRFLAEKAREAGCGGALRVLDVGAGSCDIPLAVSRWARRRGLCLQFTCLEPSASAVALARTRLALADDPDVRVLQEDVFDHRPADAYDFATASMCFHHFKDEEILEILRRLRTFVRKGVLINDLRRASPAWLGACLLTAGKPAGLRHDALVSIRRGFKISEFTTLLQRIPDCTVSVRAAWCFRISAVIAFGRA